MIGGGCQSYGTDSTECTHDTDCLDLPHEDCLGSFRCQGGACIYACLDLTSCAEAAECILADKDCCCGFGVEDYVAVRIDRLAEWAQRTECAGVSCPAVACMAPVGLSAVCLQGHCAVQVAEDWISCSQDADCVKVDGDCCGCTWGGPEGAVNREFEDVYLENLEEYCSVVDIHCPGYETCTGRLAVCRQGQCAVEGEDCGCEAIWDPVCGEGVTGTLPNECQASCLGFKWDYHGRCDCRVDCFVADPYCAWNGVTYACGQGELECSGQSVHYPGSCSMECDSCDYGDGPVSPACSQEFWTVDDSCYLSCQDQQWWHLGACLAGEGQACGPPTTEECPSSDLACVQLHSGCLECPGVCVKLGSCLQAANCEQQPLAEPDPCPGGWMCQDHACTWVCAP